MIPGECVQVAKHCAQSLAVDLLAFEHGQRLVGRGLKVKTIKSSAALGRAGVKTVSVKLPKRSLGSLRALLARGGGISLKFSVVVKDKAGASSSPVRFSVKVARR